MGVDGAGRDVGHTGRHDGSVAEHLCTRDGDRTGDEAQTICGVVCTKRRRADVGSIQEVDM